jgi:hypothetical protein
MTEAGANWVRKSLDPFHDFEITVNGMPDANNTKVVVQEVTKTITIAAPSGITSNWDCHIFTLPEMTDPSCYPMAIPTSWEESAVTQGLYGVSTSANQLASGGYPWGLVNVVAVDPGTITTPQGATAFGAHSVNDIVSFAEYMDGQKRLIALAFEVHDTTAELYKQGAVTLYRMPQSTTTSMQIVDNDTYIPSAGTIVAPCETLISRLPPPLLAQAMLLTGSQQWEAKEGCYVVCTMDAEENALEGYTFGARMFVAGDTAAGGSGLFTPRHALAVNAPPALSALVPVALRPTPFHTSGAFFSGLNVQSTLTLTVRALFESAPTPDNAQLVVLAKPSPDYDPIALEIYKAASQEMLAGCKVKDNASGDFWDSLLGIIGDVAPIVGSLIPVPGAGLIGNAVGGIAKVTQARKQVAPGFSDSPGAKNASANAAKKGTVPSQSRGK